MRQRTSMKGAGSFDGVNLITNPRCKRKWKKFEALALKNDFFAQNRPKIDIREVLLTGPLLPMLPMAMPEAAIGATGNGKGCNLAVM